jgi:hypothetical protein
MDTNGGKSANGLEFFKFENGQVNDAPGIALRI